MPEDHADEKYRRDRRKNQRGPEIGGLLRHGLRAHLTTGGVSNEWYGGGDGSVHSSESAPSQGFSGGFAPPPMHLMTTQRKINCVNPKPNAPIDESMLKSANCSA